MRKFKFRPEQNNDTVKYIIVYSDAEHFSGGYVNDGHLLDWYKIPKRTRKKLYNKYNVQAMFSLFFKNSNDAECFMEEVLIPYEIAFNMNSKTISIK